MIASVLLLALYLVTTLVLVLLGLFCLEVLLSVLPWPETTRVEPLTRLCFAVLIPAHDEQTEIGKTLQTLLPTLGAKDRVLVVADNCTDNTARIVRQAGVEVIERRDPARRGKGYALDFGLKHLESDPPDAVIFLNADSQVQPDTVRILGTAAVTMRRPAQAVNLCDRDPRGGPSHTVCSLSVHFKNLVRALGLSRLTGLCYLTGNGMALPWTLTHQLRLANDHLVDNVQLGLDLAVAGHPPLLVPHARVASPVPQQAEAGGTQRRRSVRGHLRTLLTQVPRMLFHTIRRGRPDLLALALDLATPRMALLTGLWLLTFTAALIAVPLGATAWSALLLAIGGECLLLAVSIGWFIHCRKAIRFSALCAVPFYVLSKLSNGLRSARRPEPQWGRTERDQLPPQTAAASKRV